MFAPQTLMGLGAPLLLILAVLFWWLWWTIPRRRVPKNVTKEELARIDAEEKFRQTIGQLFAGAALIGTFALTVFQTFEAQRQWTADRKAKGIQDSNQRFTEALKELNAINSPTSHVAGLYALQSLVMDKDGADYYQTKIIEILQTHIRTLANVDLLKKVGLSGECDLKGGQMDRSAREEANPEVQAAMNLLGLRNPNWKMTDSHFGLVRLDHLFLDDLDLDGVDFRGTASQGAILSNSYFRRVNFRDAHLEGADFRGTHFADWETPGFPSLGTVNSKWLYKSEKDGGEEEWRRYRCWVTDFRGAHIEGTDFSSAKLGGSDFRGAVIDLKTNFAKADISRANFMGTNITEDQVRAACGAEQPWLPTDLEKRGVTVLPCY